MTASGKPFVGLQTLVAYVSQVFLRISHNGFTLLGLALAFVMITLSVRPDLQVSGEQLLVNWLQARKVAAVGMDVEVDAIDRATAVNPKDLPKPQAAVANWLSRKYRVAPEPISALVAEAWEVGRQTRLEPTLILAVMAVESGFNPFAQSPLGAQGLMQVMTNVHTDKYEHFGGRFAAFDPVTNLRVGVKVLVDCISRAGTVEAGLKQYVGATTEDDGGYTTKVLSEQDRLRQVAQGRNVPLLATPAPAAPGATPVGVKVAMLGRPSP